MKYKAANNYNHNDTCNHLHRTESAAQKCCDKIFAFNVGSVKAIYENHDNKAIDDLQADIDKE